MFNVLLDSRCIATCYKALTVFRELLARKDFLIRHLDVYFEHVYWLPCMGFFHPETAYRQVYV